MSYVTILHALGLQMHQPPGNLQLLIETNVPEAQQIIHAYDRATRYAHKYPHSARLHVGFSGILLEQLRNPAIIDSYRQFIDIPAMLHSYAEAKNIELVGTGYFHPIFPLMPREHWRDQLLSEQQLMVEVFGRKPSGFWAPEMAFCMEMIPTLASLGYEYVILETAHIQSDSENLDQFKPYQICYDGACITAVPRHRALSAAQEHGLNPIKLVDALQPYHGSPHAPRLLTTWSNGENSTWLRDEFEGFFQRFFAPYMEHLENAQYPIQPILLSEFLRAHPPTTHAEVHAGYDFGQWHGSEWQHQLLSHLHHLSQRYQQISASQPDADLLPQIYRELLEAESSCLLFWGETWLAQLHNRLIHIESLLHTIENPTVETAIASQPDDISELSTCEPAIEPPILPSPVALAKKPIMKIATQPIDSADDVSTESVISEPLEMESPNISQEEIVEPIEIAAQNSVAAPINEPETHSPKLELPTVASQSSVDWQTRQAMIAKKKNSRRKK